MYGWKIELILKQKYFSFNTYISEFLGIYILEYILWKAQTIWNGKGQKILLYLKGTFFLAIWNIHPHKSQSKTDKYLFSVKQNIISSALKIYIRYIWFRRIKSIWKLWRKGNTTRKEQALYLAHVTTDYVNKINSMNIMNEYYILYKLSCSWITCVFSE